jgi:hypothetical protein
MAAPLRFYQGLNSPYENLMLTLLEYKHHPTIEGVFYFHDDALANLWVLLTRSMVTASDNKG